MSTASRTRIEETKKSWSNCSLTQSHHTSASAPEAGHFLNTIPYNSSLRLTNDEFRNAVQTRLSVPLSILPSSMLMGLKGSMSLNVFRVYLSQSMNLSRD